MLTHVQCVQGLEALGLAVDAQDAFLSGIARRVFSV